MLSETTFYRHLAAADEDERTRIMAVKAMSLEAAHKVVFKPIATNQPSNATSSTSASIPSSAVRKTTLQGLLKRAREDPDAQRKVGRRKCARNKENVPPEVYTFIFALTRADNRSAR